MRTHGSISCTQMKRVPVCVDLELQPVRKCLLFFFFLQEKLWEKQGGFFWCLPFFCPFFTHPAFMFQILKKTTKQKKPTRNNQNLIYFFWCKAKVMAFYFFIEVLSLPPNFVRLWWKFWWIFVYVLLFGVFGGVSRGFFRLKLFGESKSTSLSSDVRW